MFTNIIPSGLVQTAHEVKPTTGKVGGITRANSSVDNNRYTLVVTKIDGDNRCTDFIKKESAINCASRAVKRHNDFMETFHKPLYADVKVCYKGELIWSMNDYTE